MTRPFAILGSTALLAVLVAADAGGDARAALAFAFLLVAPGLAWLPPSTPVAVVVAASLAADTLVTAALLAAGAFSAPLAFALLGAVCVAGAGREAWRALRLRRDTEILLTVRP